MTGKKAKWKVRLEHTYHPDDPLKRKQAYGLIIPEIPSFTEQGQHKDDKSHSNLRKSIK